MTKDEDKTREQLIGELLKLRKMITKLKVLETKQKSAEEAFRETRNYLESLFNYANAPILVWNHAFRITRFNHAFEHLTGYKEDEIIGKELYILFPEASKDESLRKIECTLSGEYWESVEIPILCKDGDIRIALWNSANIYTKDGRTFLATIAQGQDITERKKIEIKLRESEGKYRELVENANSIIMRRDNRGRITFFNEYAQKFFGYSERDILGKDVVGTIVPETDSSGRNLRTMIENITRYPEIYATNENENMCSNGERVWVAWTNKAIRDENGRINEILCVGNDITEIKRAEKTLKDSEERYKRMVDAVTAYTYSVGVSEGHAISTKHSLGCISVTGYNPEDYEANPLLWHSMVHPDDKMIVDNSVKEILAGHEVSRIEHRIIRPDGKVVWVRNTIVYHFNEQGDLIRYDGLIEDITERKKLESQLIQAQKMEAVGTLAGGIAHDFNNILTAIISYGSILLMKTDKDNPLRSYAEKILTSSERAATLIQSLLAFSRKQIMNPKPLDINKTIKKVKSLLSRVIGENITLKTILTVEDLIVMADETQIEQVLINLAANSRDAMPQTGVLTISNERIDVDYEFITTFGYGEPGRYALITVKDTGEGMDENTRKRVFEPFFTTKEVDKGTGLGLAMVYGIIKQHDGYINCYSEPNKGTTFNIYLPLINKAITEETKPLIYITKGGRETILIAEDDADVRQSSKGTLEESGYRVIETVDGEDAIRKFMAKENKWEIRLLILDVIMPKKNGKEVYEAIKKERPDIRAIFISGYTADRIHKKWLIEERSELLLKPFSPDKLLRKIRDVLDKRV